MSLIVQENVVAAQYMYTKRIEFLRLEVNRIVNRGLRLGEEYEDQIMEALDEVEGELERIDECLDLLRYLRGE